MDVELTIIDHNGVKSRVFVSKPPAIIGRDSNAVVHLEDPWVSPFHCQISDLNGIAVAQDLGSKYALLVDGKRLTELQLQPGDSVTVHAVMAAARERAEP